MQRNIWTHESPLTLPYVSRVSIIPLGLRIILTKYELLQHCKANRDSLTIAPHRVFRSCGQTWPALCPNGSKGMRLPGRIEPRCGPDNTPIRTSKILLALPRGRNFFTRSVHKRREE